MLLTYNGTSLYPFGSNDWYVYNDTCKDVDKFDKEINKMTLNLNACNPNSEYQDCIPCYDMEDEEQPEDMENQAQIINQDE